MDNTEIRIPAGTNRSEFTIKNSRFISIAEPIESSESVKARIKELWKEHPAARHIVYAYTYGKNGEQFGLSDDGEPHGTAGRPVLEVLKGRNLTWTLVSVIRYFGGTKLGTGGLVNAYTQAAKDVLEDLAVQPLRETVRFRFEIEYGEYQPLKDNLPELEGVVLEEEFQTAVKLFIEIPRINETQLQQKIRDLTKGRVELKEE